MNHAAIDWDEDLPLDPSEEYEAMLTALRRVQNFGLLFVLCSPAEGKKLIQKVQLDLPQKKIEVLQFDQPIPDGNFYRQINDFFKQKGQVDILFIQGLEHSLYDYEDRKREAGWSDAEIYAYSWKGTPRILTNLNQQRERLRDNFKTCFVFLIPPFILNYLIQRAPDFFDWRSGVFKVPMDANRVRQESLRVCSEHQSFEEYQTLTPQERRDKIIEIKNLIDEPYQTSESRANLFVKLGGYQDAENEHRAAIDSYNKAIEIKIKPDDHEAWYYRGVALSALGHNEEAIDSYRKAIDLKPDYYQAWFSLGNALSALGDKEHAIDSYNKAIEIKPDDHEAWYYRGVALSVLGRNEEAIDSYRKAIDLKPDYYQAWFNLGNALSALGHNEEAIDSYRKAIDLKPDYYQAWFNLGNALSALGHNEEAIDSYRKAIDLKPDYYQAWFNLGNALSALGDKEHAIDSYNKAIETTPDLHQAWYYRGVALSTLGRNEEAVVSYRKVIDLKPDYYQAWFNLGKALSALGRYKEAIDSYDKASELKPGSLDAWLWLERGLGLHYLGCYEESIRSYNKAIELNSNYEIAWYNRACDYALLGDRKQAIENLRRAIELNPENREWAKTETDFDSVREDEQFRSLVEE